MSEPDFDIDAAAEQFDKGKAPEGDAPPTEGKQHDTFDGDEPAKSHKSYDEYIADGGDPDRYKGKQAFEDERERIAENKRLRGEVKSLKQTVQQTADAVGDLVQQARDETRSEIEDRMRQAREDEDFDAYDKATEDLAEHDKKAPAATPEYVEPEPIQNFRAENPIIDPEAEEFDAEFNGDLEATYNDIYHRLSNGGRRKLSDTQLNRILNKAMAETRDLYDMKDEPPAGDGDGDGDEGDGKPDPDVSPRNQRRQGAPARRRSAAREAEPRAEDFKIQNPKNNRDTDATGVRDMIHRNAFQAAKKAGKSDDDAKAAADEAAKNFERNLHQ